MIGHRSTIAALLCALCLTAFGADARSCRLPSDRSSTTSSTSFLHRNSVVDGSLKDLQPRDPLELVVQIKGSEIGPQASTVRPIGTKKYDPS